MPNKKNLTLSLGTDILADEILKHMLGHHRTTFFIQSFLLKIITIAARKVTHCTYRLHHHIKRMGKRIYNRLFHKFRYKIKVQKPPRCGLYAYITQAERNEA